MVMLVVPSELCEVISDTPAMWPNCRSRGVATEEAMISALAPGRDAPTEMVGKIDLRQGRDGQRPVGDGSGQRNPHRDQGRRHRPANERSGEVHAGVGCSGWPAGAGGPEGCTASFSRGAAAGWRVKRWERLSKKM